MQSQQPAVGTNDFSRSRVWVCVSETGCLRMQTRSCRHPAHCRDMTRWWREWVRTLGPPLGIDTQRRREGPAKVGFATDLYGAFPVKRLFLGFAHSSLFGAGKAVLRPVACDQVPGARGRGQGTETLAELGGVPP